ncbi:MAG TPA: methyltransferase domain-containing protein [Gaiellaceae bacterium]
MAYLLGLEGVALLRAFDGAYDREFTLARLREIRTLLDSAEELGEAVEAHPIAAREVYAGWAESYDEPGRNQLLDIEQPVVWEILDDFPVGVALDAACGTGRHSAYLESLGHTVIGVDDSPEMIERARAKVPAAEFHEGDLHALPLPDDHVDLVVCGLALMHVPDLDPVLREFVRVLRPGGHLVISDWRGIIGDIRFPVVRETADGRAGYLPTWCRPTSEYLAAAFPLGLELRRCEEPRRPDPLVDDEGTSTYDVEHGNEPPEPHTRGDPPNVWSLHRRAPEATNAAWRGSPAAIVLHFQLAEA